jgi:outer membrane protein OmpA-like peptidoglycan-associated protein
VGGNFGRTSNPSSSGGAGAEGTPAGANAESLDVDEAVAHPDQFFHCGRKITLSGDLLFDHDKDDLRDDSIPVLKKVSRLIHARSQRDLIVDVVGHTDTTGSEWYNDGLSLRRANTVARFLRDDRAIDHEHIRVGGHGSREPLVPGGNVAEQAANRRVEIVVDCAK